MAEAINKPLSFIFAHPNYQLSEKDSHCYSAFIKKRQSRMPLAYIVQKKYFFGLKFYVDNSVLIPRPETEILVESIIKLCQKDKKITRLADIGTGCGNIAISLAYILKKCRIDATDISKDALLVALKNAKNYKVSNRVKFYQGSLLEPLIGKKYHLITANLPYLEPNEVSKPYQNNQVDLWESEIEGLKYEPRVSLVGGYRGIELYSELIKQLSKFDSQPKYIFFEIGYKQKLLITKLIKKHLPGYSWRFIKDFSGYNRIIALEKRLYSRFLI